MMSCWKQRKIRDSCCAVLTLNSYQFPPFVASVMFFFSVSCCFVLQRASWPPVSLWKSSSFSVSLCCRARVDMKMYPPMYSCTTLQSAFTQPNAMLMFPSNSIAT